MQHSPHVRVINCKDVVTSHGGYRATGQVWAYMSQELTSPHAAQFVTLPKTAEALNAVFLATGGTMPGRDGRLAGRHRETRRPRKARRKS
jgi:hypothetical protein